MQNEILNLAKKLISFKTVTGNSQEIAACFDFIKNYFKTEIKNGKIIAKKYANDGHISMVFSNFNTLKPDIILNGHIDVVAANDKEFIPRIENGKLYGRGAADMKSQVAAMTAIFKELINNGFKKSIALILSSDEEIGGDSGIGYLADNIEYRGKIAIIPDGGKNFELNIKEKGLFWIKIFSRGKSAHGSRPWLGKNATLNLMEFYKELEKVFPPLKKTKSLYQDGISINLGKISGGESTNSVPETAEMHLDIRYSERKNKKMIMEKIKHLAKKTKTEFEIINAAEIAETDPENAYFIKFKKLAEKIIGRRIKITKSTGASDARFFSKYDIPIIMTSPYYGNIHAANEWVEIKSLEKFSVILKDFIQSI